METIWKLQDAKAQFSKIVNDALKKGPQYVTRRGTKAVVVVSVQEYEELVLEKPSFKEFLLNLSLALTTAPTYGADEASPQL